MVNGQGIIAVHITEESEKQGTAEGPWLALVVAEIFDFQTYFFHYFTVYGFFDGFPDFCETCNQSIAFEAASFIFGEDDLIFVCNLQDTEQDIPDCRRRGIPSYVLSGCEPLVFRNSHNADDCCTTGTIDVL